ncbi:TPA: hypothetical protein ACQUHP_005921 [Bacillus cereus]
MVYKELAPAYQYSFRSDLSRVLRFFLKDIQYVVIEENKSFVTEEFLQVFKGYLEGSTAFIKWNNIGFTIDCLELQQLLQSQEPSLRKRSSTLKHRNYFYRLLLDLGIQEELPKDFLYLKKRLLELEAKKKRKESRKNKRSVSRRQIENLQRAWQKTFGRMIEVPKEITQEEMNELFFRIHKKQCKVARKQREYS